MVGGARALVENSAPGALSADFAACMAFDDARGVAARVICPVTVIAGLGDKMTPASAGRRLASSLSNVELVELAATGHMMMFESPRDVRRILLDRVVSTIEEKEEE